MKFQPIGKRPLRVACGMLLCLTWLAAQQASGQAAPDYILYNGKILTVDSSFSTAEAVAVRGRQIAAVGANQEVRNLAGPDTVVIDLKGRMVVPGLIDTHTHIHGYAEEAYGSELEPGKLGVYNVDWRGVNNKDDVLNQVRGLMEKYKFPPGEWVYFNNVVQFRRGGSVEQVKILYDDLNRWELDKVAPDNPILLSLGIPDFNGFLLNSKAIDILWSQHGDFIRKYGRYWIDSEGQPEGHLEPPASRLLLEIMPWPEPDVVAPLYKKYLEELAASGLTTVSTRLPKYSLEAYKILEAQGELSLRMAYGMEWVFGNVTDLENDMKELSGLVGSGDDKVWVTSIAPTAVDGGGTRACTNAERKGVLEAIDSYWPNGQCHMDVEFRGAAGKTGPIYGNYYKEWATQSGLNGVRFANTHVAGDRSVKAMLDVMEDIQKKGGASATQGWALDHCRYVNPADMPQAARLGVTFSCAPKYIEDSGDVAKAFTDEMANTYIVPVKTMLDAGVKVVYEADRDEYVWSELELLIGRKDEEGKVWGPQERIDRQTALKMITRWAAEYVLKADELGSLEPGKLADLVVLDRDFLTIPLEEISDIRPRLTMMDGKIVHLHPEFSAEHSLQPPGAVIATYEELSSRRTSRRRLNF